MFDVVFYETFQEEEIAIRKFLPSSLKVQFVSSLTQEDDLAAPSATLISIRTQSLIPKTWSTHVRGILTRSSGYDHVLAYRRQSGYPGPLGFLPDYCSRAVAEQAILLLMALWRKLRKQTMQFERFNRDGITGYECQGKHVLVLGVGKIGREVVDIARGLRMSVCGFDIKPALADLKYVDLVQGLTWADAVICALPLTTQTEGLLTYKLFKDVQPARAQSLKPGPVLLINVSRGEISPVADMKRLLDEGLLRGLGLDVYENEGLLAQNLRGQRIAENACLNAILELKDRDNVIFTPHNAFNTQESLERKAEQSVAAIVHFLDKGLFPHPVPVS